MSDQEIDRNAKIIWDYMHLGHELRKSDALLVLGNRDLQTAHRACDLYFQGYAPLIIFSGDRGEEKVLPKPEAEMFEDIALQRGVPSDALFIENKSRNTGENIKFTKKLIEERGLNIHSLIIVQKPYVERRVYATVKKQWPEIDFIVTSDPVSYEKYTYDNPHYSSDEVIGRMVGDFQRVVEYPKQGFQISQPVDDAVLRAFKYLVDVGFNKKLIKP